MTTLGARNCYVCNTEVSDQNKYCPTCGEPLWIDRYKVLEKLGGGRFGTVYRAFNPLFPDPKFHVAIKIFHEPIPETKETDRELQLLQLLPRDHSNLVKVHEDSCREHIVMDYIPGRNLYKRVMEQHAETLQYYEQIIKGICQGLTALHTTPIIHRDLKPENILVTEDWIPKIVDMGLAKIVRPSSPPTSKVGSPEIMAPEVIAAAHGEAYDQTADLWALGVILYFIWTQRYPFGATVPDREDTKRVEEILINIASGQYPPPQDLNPQIPTRIIRLIEELLVKIEAPRLASAQTVLNLMSDLPYQEDTDPKSYPLVDYQRQLAFLYGKKNAAKQPAYLVCRVLSHIRFLREVASEEGGNKWAEFEEYLPRVFSWLCALVEAAGWAVDDIILFKYNNCCPYCLQKPCTQDHPIANEEINERLLQEVLKRRTNGTMSEEDAAQRRRHEEWTFGDFARMFKEIYGPANIDRSLTELREHLYQETSEFADILFAATKERRRSTTAAMYLELADLFAWFFAIYNALPEGTVDFEGAFWPTFKTCPKCGTVPCTRCPDAPDMVSLKNWRLSRATLDALDIAGAQT